MYLAGQLDMPGKGIMFMTTLDKVARLSLITLAKNKLGFLKMVV